MNGDKARGKFYRDSCNIVKNYLYEKFHLKRARALKKTGTRALKTTCWKAILGTVLRLLVEKHLANSTFGQLNSWSN
jgi:hypothetical protein